MGSEASRPASRSLATCSIASHPRCPHEFPKCSEVPPREARLEGKPGHEDRCWLSPDEKREKREVRPGEIGLGSKEGVEVG